MAFPQVSDADTKHGDVTSSSSSWSLTYPTNIAAGDLLLLLAGPSGNPTPSATGWTVLLKATNSSGLALNVLGKVATGSETGSFTLSMSGGAVGGWRTMRITAWFGGTLTAGTTSNASSGISAATTTGTSTSANPPSLTPAWGSDDDLWFAIAVAQIIDNPLTGTPTSYTNAASDGTTSSVVAIRHSRRELTATSDDPSTYTSANDLWVSGTLAIRPAQTITIANAGVATITGSVNASSDTVSGASGAGSLTLAAQAPTETVKPNAGNSAMTLAASAPTPQAKPSPGASAATITAQTPASSVGTSPGNATATLAAQTPSITGATPAGTTSATVTGQSATPQTAPGTGSATGVVTAFDGRALVIVPASVAAIAVAAYDATVSTSGGAPEYGLATSTVTAPGALLSVSARGAASRITGSLGLTGSASHRAAVSVASNQATLDVEDITP